MIVLYRNHPHRARLWRIRFLKTRAIIWKWKGNWINAIFSQINFWWPHKHWANCMYTMLQSTMVLNLRYNLFWWLFFHSRYTAWHVHVILRLYANATDRDYRFTDLFKCPLSILLNDVQETFNKIKIHETQIWFVSFTNNPFYRTHKLSKCEYFNI